jgi:hypothetical protein
MIKPPGKLRSFAGLRSWLNALLDFVVATRVVESEEIDPSEHPNGTTLHIKGQPAAPAAGASVAATSHPFQVLTRQKEGGGYEAKVVLESSLYKSLRPNDKETITGLDTWFELIGNDAIWLGIVFDSDGSVTSASIDSWGQSDSFDLTQSAWSGEDGYCEDDEAEDIEDAKHQTSRKLIAYSVAGDEGEPILTQAMFHDQVLRDCNIDGRPARYPFDHAGGYPVT